MTNKHQINTDEKKAKWLLGGAGIAVSALLLTQMQYANSKSDVMPPLRDFAVSHSTYLELEHDEQTLLTMDWEPFIEENKTANAPVERKTRAS